MSLDYVWKPMQAHGEHVNSAQKGHVATKPEPCNHEQNRLFEYFHPDI